MAAAAALTTSIAMTVKRSWADVAKGGGEVKNASHINASAALKPGRQGSLLCQCRGEVLMMLSHYGWLMVYGKVEHPAAGKHEGHVYVNTDDIVGGNSLEKGDVVSFYLYVDEKGLGAEMVEVEQPSAERVSLGTVDVRPSQSIDAATPKPCMSPNAVDFVPTCKQSIAPSVAFGMNAVAQEFVPSGAFSLRADAQEFIPSCLSLLPKGESDIPAAEVDKAYADVSSRLSNVFNLAYLSDDEDGDCDCMDSVCQDGGGSSHDGDAESSGDESDCSSTHDKVFNKPVALPWPPPQCGPSVVRQAVSSDASTTSGLSSDSEGESGSEWLLSDMMMPPAFRPPPGLSLPVGFRPPPGLSFPQEFVA